MLTETKLLISLTVHFDVTKCFKLYPCVFLEMSYDNLVIK